MTHKGLFSEMSTAYDRVFLKKSKVLPLWFSVFVKDLTFPYMSEGIWKNYII